MDVLAFGNFRFVPAFPPFGEIQVALMGGIYVFPLKIFWEYTAKIMLVIYLQSSCDFFFREMNTFRAPRLIQVVLNDPQLCIYSNHEDAVRTPATACADEQRAEDTDYRERA